MRGFRLCPLGKSSQAASTSLPQQLPGVRLAPGQLLRVLRKPQGSPLPRKATTELTCNVFKIQFINTYLCPEIPKIGCLLVMNK